MTRAGLPVPDAFVVTTEGHRVFCEANGLHLRVAEVLGRYDPESPSSAGVSRALRQAIMQAEFPGDLMVAVLDAYARLMAPGTQSVRVAVRSSAVGEDAADHSFAGLFETFLNVEGPEQLLDRIRLCWASAYTERALAYRARGGLTHEAPMAVVVQVMADAEKSGVMFTAHPTTGNRARLVIEAAWGLGEPIVQGEVTPDHVELDRTTRRVVSELIGMKEFKVEWRSEAGATQSVDLREDARWRERVLTGDDLARLADLATRVEELYGAPQDVEFAIVRGDVLLTQCRPITTGGTVHHAANGTGTAPPLAGGAQVDGDSGEGHLLPLKGLPASPGRASGAVRVLAHASDQGALRAGEVLVTRMTTPDWVPAMRRAAAIVTDAGGMTSHAAIVARELGVPCVVGTREATRILGTGHVVTVDGTAGTVTNGAADAAAVPPPHPATHEHAAAPPVTVTRVYVNLADPERAASVAAGDVDGVGLLRAEFMLVSALDGTHPREFLARHGSGELATRLAAQLTTIVAAFHPRPVIYRAMDFRSNEFRNLTGGTTHEPTEENPMLGYRGCFRYGREPDLFGAELSALATVRERFPGLHLMLPFVRTPGDLRTCLRLVDESPLGRDRELRRWIMAEVPSVAHRLPEYASLGIHGVSIGSNDLTQLMLGVDRDNELLADLWDERDAAVLATIRAIITQCRTLGLTCSICGQAPSVHPDYAARLVEWGIDSISVNPDAVDRTRRNVAAAEGRMMLEVARREGVRQHSPSR
jgi:pyruvate,water dikinase